MRVWPNSFVGATYEEEVDHLKGWLATRADWMHVALTQEFGAYPG